MKITAVKTFLLEHPMRRATGPSNIYYRIRRTLLIKLETDTGLCGWGETAAFGGLRSLIEDTYAPLLLGRDPRAHRSLWRQLWGANFGNGMALGGVDIALDDLRGKALGVPVSDLYGGRLRDRVMCYASTMNYVEGEDPAVINPREATARVEQGFRALKMRLGGQAPDQDLAAATAVRNAVGPKIMLMADGNGAYTLGGAIKMGRALEELDFAWWEEPLPQETPTYPAYEVLAASLDIPIAACEALASRGQFHETLSRRAMDIVQPDASLAGGIGECLFVAEMAALYGIPTMPHCWGGAIVIAATAHLVSLLPDASWSRHTQEPMVEYDLVENPFREELLVRPLELKDGRITVPTGPGLGIEIDEDVVRRYAKA